jgi:predicted RNase H-like HicB family nuclease
MKALKYIVYKEGSYFVSQCLNVDVSSFGDTIEQAIENLNEALTLYFEDNKVMSDIPVINETLLGEFYINA